MLMFRHVDNGASLLPGAPWLSQEPDLQSHVTCRLIQDSSLFSQMSRFSIIDISVHPPVYWSMLPYRKPNLSQKCKEIWSKSLSASLSSNTASFPISTLNYPNIWNSNLLKHFLNSQKRNYCRYLASADKTLHITAESQPVLTGKACHQVPKLCPQECAGGSKG